MHGAKNMSMKASLTQSLGPYELKQPQPWFHEEYLQSLVQTKQAKIQLFAGSQPKQCRESKQCKALSLQVVQEKNLKAKINEFETNNYIKNIRESITSILELI
jgi:hypothetical protein